MKYVIYLRVSTEYQVGGLGIQAQRELCKSYIARFGPPDFLEFSDEGISGAASLEKRPALMAALSSLGKGDIFLISRRDRLGRDSLVNALIEREVEKKKAKIVSASGDTKNDNDASSFLTRRMMDVIAEYERKIISERISAVMQLKKSRGECVGRVPYGYQKCPDKIHIEKNEYEQFILQKISEFRSQKISFNRIANALNARELYNRGNSPWNHRSIQRVMK